MCKADLDWVKHLVQRVVNTNDLDVLKLANLTLNTLVRSQCLKESTIAVRCQLELTLTLQHNLSTCVESGKHLLREEYE